MTPKSFNAAELCRRLGDGWGADQPEAPRELLARMCARLHAPASRESSGNSAYRAAIELNHVRLHGVSELGCLILSGGADAAAEFEVFWRELGGVGRLGLVLAADDDLAERARRYSRANRCAVLGPTAIHALLVDAHPLEQLKRELRAQIPRRTLVAYDVTHPASPNMFFGRRDILERFHLEEMTSFAVAGPGRVGKSSILRQYLHELRMQSQERYKRVRLIDCYAYAAYDANEFARRIALEFSADSTANRVNQATLQYYLKVLTRAGREPVEILFDEVDLVCDNGAFLKVAEAVKEGYCRVILCGKGALHRMMRSKDKPLAARLQLLQPEPLDAASAGQLLLEPLLDVGFSLDEYPVLQTEVFALTRRMPHLIQACARQMALLALGEGSDVITRNHLTRVRAEFGQLLFGALPLDSLEDDVTRIAALFLVRRGCGEITVRQLHEMLAREEIDLPVRRVLDICYDLWICNILSFEHDSFTLANPTLVEFVRKQGILEDEIPRLLRLLVPAGPRRPALVS